jgi:hypothetical protein
MHPPRTPRSLYSVISESMLISMFYARNIVRCSLYFRDRHAALTIKNLDPLIESLERHGVTYTFSRSGRRAVFLRDIDANALEFVEDTTM